MPKKYPVEVRLFAVQKKAEGHSWDRVAEMVGQDFGLDPPPSRRQMTKWAGKGASDSLAHLAMKKVEQDLPKFGAEWLDKQREPLLSMIVEVFRGKDFRMLMAKWFFSQLESLLGTDCFRMAVDEFLQEQDQYQEAQTMVRVSDGQPNSSDQGSSQIQKQGVEEAEERR